jgi:hypothetical protein
VRLLAGRLKRDEGLAADPLHETFCLLVIGVLFDEVQIGLDDLELQ